MLKRLDWKRLIELVQGLVSVTGMQVFDTEINEDGGGLVTTSTVDDDEATTLIEVGVWNRLTIGVGDLRNLRGKARTKGGLHPICVTVGRFSPDARKYGEEFGVELVDGPGLVEVLETLPRAASDDLFRIATREGYEIPTCPYCFRPLEMASVRLMSTTPSLQKQAESIQLGKATLRFDEDGLVGTEIVCHTIVVAADVEVHFTKPVTAMVITIEGTATGDLRAMRTITLGPNAHVIGSLAARTMDIKVGAIIDGSTQIQKSFLVAQNSAPPETEVWRCSQAHKSTRCGSLLFEPRDF